MKKVLFATTALVAFAGAAAAEITMSGSAEMGIIGGDEIETQFWQDIDISFALRGTTDNGLSFGANVDLDESDDETGIGGTELNDHGTTVFISGSFGTLTLGDTDGALDWALTEAGNVGNPGSIADDETAHDGYNGSYLDGDGDGQILRYDNTFGAVGIAVSVEQEASGGDGEVLSGDETGWAIGLRYALDLGGTTVNLGVGHQVAASDNDDTATGISATASLAGGFSAGIVFSDWELGGSDVTHTGIGLGYESGPLALHANYGVYDDDVSETDGWGFAAAYDLGGGASVNLGYGSDDDDSTYSLGVVMSF